MKRLKVLHLVKTLSLGGAETNLYNLIHAFTPGKIECHVGYSFGGEIEQRFLDANIRLFKYASGEHKLRSWASAGIIFRLARYILENRIDIVHTHVFNAHVWGMIASKLTGRKVVEHVHDFRYFDPLDYRKRYGTNQQYRFVRYFKNLSDRVVVLTQQNQDFLLKNKLYPDQRILRIPNGIPVNGHHPRINLELRKRMDIGPDDAVILTLARIAPEKNIDLILRIAPKVLQQYPNTVFLISGNGPYLEELQSIASELGLEKQVRLIGYSSNVYDLLSVADIFLLPSFLELHPIALLEAMSMRLPCVLSRDVGCHNDFIKNWVNGVLLDPFTDQGWADALIQLVDSPEIRKTMGYLGYLTCLNHFNIKNTAAQFEEVYTKIVDGREQTPWSVPCP